MNSAPRGPLHFEVLTLFPEVFDSFFASSLLGKALASGRISARVTQIRDFATDRHRTVDDRPFGGGPGMLLRADVLHAAWKAVRTPGARTLLLSPQGPVLTESKIRALGPQTEGASVTLILVCGHYEGVDQRFIDLCVDEEVSIGDYVLTGGEVPAMVLMDAVARWVPGVVGKADSVEGDAFSKGGLKAPQYTRPRVYEGLEVPEVLLSGDHAKIEAWRAEAGLVATRRKRPDLVP